MEMTKYRSKNSLNTLNKKNFYEHENKELRIGTKRTK
jgi:hypothetical protein